MGLFDFFRKTEWRVDPLSARHAPQIAALHGASFARGWSVGRDRRADVGPQCHYATCCARRPSARHRRLRRCRASPRTKPRSCRSRCHRRRRGKGGKFAAARTPLRPASAAGARRVSRSRRRQCARASALSRFGFSEVGARPAYYARAPMARGDAHGSCPAAWLIRPRSGKSAGLIAVRGKADVRSFDRRPVRAPRACA